jgi:hypothetical protein
MTQGQADPAAADLDRLPRPLVIGWKERLEFLEWSISRVRVKIDTGARTSALDVVGYELLDGTARVKLSLDRRHPERVREVLTPVLGMVRVRNTSCQYEERPLIETLVRLGSVRKRIRLTLTSRAGMCYRMILGREALCGDFIVDVRRKYLLGP